MEYDPRGLVRYPLPFLLFLSRAQHSPDPPGSLLLGPHCSQGSSECRHLTIRVTGTKFRVAFRTRDSSQVHSIFNLIKASLEGEAAVGRCPKPDPASLPFRMRHPCRRSLAAVDLAQARRSTLGHYSNRRGAFLSQRSLGLEKRFKNSLCLWKAKLTYHSTGFSIR